VADARATRGERLGVALLLGLFVLLAALSARHKNPTFDETAHLPAGISYVKHGDFRMNPEHPALPKLLAGAAAALTGVDAPDSGAAWDSAEQWDYGREVLYGPDVDWRRVLFAGRLPMILIGAALGVALWSWVRAMAGPSAAFLALVLYSFAPNFLAHTRLVTTDVPLTATVTLTAACLWRAWATGRMAWILAAAFGVALSMATKFSAFSYAPVWALLAILPGPARSWRRGALHVAALGILSLVLTEALLFVTYGFATDWVSIRALGMQGRGVDPSTMSLLRRAPYEVMASIPWPSESFARGMKDVILYTEAGHPVYLMGMRADTGWWWSSFVALGVKMPLPVLGLIGWAAVRTIRRPALRRRDLWFLVAPAALVLATNVLANLGLGVRHLLPMFPFLFAYVALCFADAFRAGRARIALGALLLWHVAGTVAAHPHYLPFFNEIARVSGGGARFLGDSNLDWGQDLSAASSRLKERGVRGAILSYFGTADPFVEGMTWQLLPPAARGRNLDEWTVLPEEGPQWLVVSTTNLQGIYYRVPEGGDPYPWLEGRKPDEVVGHGTIGLYDITRDEAAQRGLLASYLRHGMRTEAEHAARQILRLVPYDSEVRLALVELLASRGDLESVERTIRDAPNPDEALLLRMVDTQRAMGKVEEARETYRRAMRILPHSADLKNSYAWFLQERDEQLDVARQLADEAVDWVPEDVYYRDTRAVVRMKQGDVAGALEDLEFALARPDGDLPDIHWHRALALVEAGRKDEAIAEVEALALRNDLGPELEAEVQAWLHGLSR
jgi:Flp pilus assembly protein TadD